MSQRAQLIQLAPRDLGFTASGAFEISRIKRQRLLLWIASDFFVTDVLLPLPAIIASFVLDPGKGDLVGIWKLQGDGEFRVLGPSPFGISLFPDKVLPVIGIAQVQAIPIAPAMSRMGDGNARAPEKSVSPP